MKIYFYWAKNDFDVRTVFQIWKRKNFRREKVQAQKPRGYSFVKDDTYNFLIRRVGMKSGFAFFTADPPNTDSYYRIRLETRQLGYHVAIVKKINGWKCWNFRNVGIRNISKMELIPLLNDIVEGVTQYG